MNLFTKRLALLSAAVIGTGAIASVATGATFALFSSSAATNLSQTYSAGTVTLGGSTTDAVTLSNIVPGDCSYQGSGPYSWTIAPCDNLDNTASYTLNYSGKAPAFVGVDLTFTATGNLPLWDPNNSNGGLEVRVGTLNQYDQVSDILDGIGAGGYPFASADLTCSGTTTTTCTATIDNIELPVGGTSGVTPDYGNVIWAGGDSQTLYVDWLFQNGTSDNQFQGESATVTIQGHAVQAGGGNTTLVVNGNSAANGFSTQYPPNKCDSANLTTYNSSVQNPTQSYSYLPTAPTAEFGGGVNYACPSSW